MGKNSFNLSVLFLSFLISVPGQAQPRCFDLFKTRAERLTDIVDRFYRARIPVRLQWTPVSESYIEGLPIDRRTRKDVIEAFRSTAVSREIYVRNFEFHGTKTRAVVLLKEESSGSMPIVVERNSVGDPLTVDGQENLRTNIRIAQAEFEYRLLGRLLAECCQIQLPQ